METLYGLKRKTTNRWLKLLLLLFVAVGFGVPNLNAQSKTIKVANNQQLIEAMGNRAISTIYIEPGYYQYLNLYQKSGGKLIKSNGGGNRDQDCQYFIEDADYCIPTQDLIIDPSGIPPGSYYPGIAIAGSQDISLPPCGCCPPFHNMGTWSWIKSESTYAPGDTLFFGLPLNQDHMDFYVTGPGVYALKYSWPAPYNAYVKADYIFRGPSDVELSAPDVCGTSDTVTFVLEGLDVFTFDVEWLLENMNTGIVYTVPIPPALDSTGQFILDVDNYGGCGYYKLSAIVFTHSENEDEDACGDTTTIFIDFACQPIADAGPDVSLCDDLCYYSLHGSYGGVLLSPTHSWMWVQLSGPPGGELIFDDPLDLVTGVCATDTIDDCPYGDYEVEFQVQNGECSDADTMILRFYETPVIDAGPDMAFCNTFAFSLFGVGDAPCNPSTVVVYSWEKSKEPGNCTVTFNPPDNDTTGVVISDCQPDSCQYGVYIFKLTQSNGYYNDAGQFVPVCTATDSVKVTIFEQPVADAGPDVLECVDIAFSPYCFSMVGTMDYCYTMHGIWTKSCGPGDVVLTDINDPTTNVCFPAPGRYEFIWTLSNDMCEDADTVVFDLVEQPTAFARDTVLLNECDSLCIDLGLAGVVKYIYFGTNLGDCPNFNDLAHWSYVAGPTGDPAEVSFADDTDPGTELCVSTFGCYTVRWNEVNKLDDQICSAYVDVYVQFVETPVAFAGDDTSICGTCYTLAAIPSSTANTNCPPYLNQSFWEFLGYIPPEPFCDLYTQYSPCFNFTDGDGISNVPAVNNPNAEICICDDDYYGSHYGTYGFIWTETNGPCTDRDTVWITFNKIPDQVPLTGCIYNDNCMYNYFGPTGRDVANCGCVDCWYPEDGVFTVCSNTCGYMYIDWDCLGFPPIPGYTYEWSFIGPAGSSFQAQPYYYDCECGWVGSSEVYLCFGECCDTARLYLTITSQEGCVTTEEWKFYVQHPPVATITGPVVAEVGDVFEYSIPDPLNTCYLYTWNVQHCGEIVYGQGTGTIGVHWTNYNINGGWGLINVCVYDTCTCCCSCDSLVVKIYPQNTLGDATLAGHVYYHNAGNTPLDGVVIQLWNGGIPVMSTTSFDDVEDGNGVGYFEFPGINGTTNFGITATYDAPWYGANATDALAVQLEVISALPGGFIFDNVVAEAMDVNNSNTISATDALWIKQRAINMVNYFPAGDWVFDPTMSASAASTPYDIYTLNAGDANRSNIPNSMKAAPAIDLVTDGTINVTEGQVFDLPVRIADANQFSAITLDLGFNSALIQVVDVVPMDGMLYNVSDGNLKIAWTSVNPMVLAANDVVVTLKVKAISPIASAESMFSIGLNTEFADGVAKVIEPVTLKTYGVTTGPAATDYFLSANRPNPFSNSTFIEYTMPESGKVKLSVLDMLGQELAVLVDATQSAGSYTVEFSAAGLSTGVYIYKITVDGETRDFISTQRMVISH